jgi:hypothetical protein
MIMRKRLWPFQLLDALSALAGILGIIACWHLGWRAVVAVVVVIGAVLLIARLIGKRIRTIQNSN